MLTRLVMAEGKLQIDASGKMRGRGAYLCENPRCWASSWTGSLLTRALRHELSDDDRAHLRQMTPS